MDPWIYRITTLDYLTCPEKWLTANLKIAAEFPEVIFLPGFWVEYGMANEPSGFGCKIHFYDQNTPTIEHIISEPEEYQKLNCPNPLNDGLMPLVLNLYRRLEPQVNESGHLIKVVAARGPLAIAAHLMGVSDFLVGLKVDPDNTHQLLKITTAATKNWLEAQANVLQAVEGILVLDDIIGFLSKDDYLQFAHPYLKEIYASFPGTVKILHNDTDNPSSYEFIAELGVNIFNFTHLRKMETVRQLVGDQVCLMGNVPPRDILAGSSPEEVQKVAVECIQSNGGSKGLLLSAGGGVSPGTSAENIKALTQAVRVVR